MRRGADVAWASVLRAVVAEMVVAQQDSAAVAVAADTAAMTEGIEVVAADASAASGDWAATPVAVGWGRA